MKRSKLLVFISTVALVLSMMLPSFASAQYLANGVYYIKNKNSGYLMSVNGAQTYDGARIVQWYDERKASQQWKIEYLYTDSWYGEVYKITNVYSGKVLEVPGYSTTWGRALDQWSDNGGKNQQWFIHWYGDTVSLQNYYNRTVADVSGASRDAGVSIINWGPNKGDNQRWYLIRR